ncbi:PREDICTED: protein ripply1 [Haliaeetus leucocephalus]|uniref:protein ripply1 n=1 Tax=Haliaeetus leucocephalus TaxID=52644 RepID=UPI00053CCC94|nr:PREDICTED: protein ripply1 [Haliaeetus leucocephalus]
MEAAACCLPPDRLPVPGTSAPLASGLEQGGRSLPLWRPWLPRAEEGTEQRRQQTDTAWAREAAGNGGPDKALAFFHHPVRLLWPKSKSFDYLYGVGEKLLENFPVQATLCLYEDSGSEEEEEEEEEEEPGDMASRPPPQAGSPGRPT